MRISDWSSDVCSSDLLHDQTVLLRGDRRSSIGVGRTPLAAPMRLAVTRPWKESKCMAKPPDAKCGSDAPTVHAKVGRSGARKRQFFDQEARTKIWHSRNGRSEEHTSELQSLMRISYAVFCLKKKK